MPARLAERRARPLTVIGASRRVHARIAADPHAKIAAVVELAGVQLIGVAAAAGHLVLFLAGAVGVRLRAHEHRYIFITLGYPVLAIASLSSPPCDSHRRVSV